MFHHFVRTLAVLCFFALSACGGDDGKQENTEAKLRKAIASCKDANKSSIQELISKLGHEKANSIINSLAPVIPPKGITDDITETSPQQSSSIREDDLKKSLESCLIASGEYGAQLIRSMDQKELEELYEVSKPLLFCATAIAPEDMQKTIYLWNEVKAPLINQYGQNTGQAMFNRFSAEVGIWFEELSENKKKESLAQCVDLYMDVDKQIQIAEEMAEIEAELVKKEQERELQAEREELEKALVCAIFAEQAFPGQTGRLLLQKHIDYAKAKFSYFTDDDINDAELAADKIWKVELSSGMNREALNAGFISVTDLKQKVYADVLSCNDYNSVRKSKKHSPTEDVMIQNQEKSWAQNIKEKHEFQREQEKYLRDQQAKEAARKAALREEQEIRKAKLEEIALEQKLAEERKAKLLEKLPVLISQCIEKDQNRLEEHINSRSWIKDVRMVSNQKPRHYFIQKDQIELTYTYRSINKSEYEASNGTVSRGSNGETTVRCHIDDLTE